MTVSGGPLKQIDSLGMEMPRSSYFQSSNSTTYELKGYCETSWGGKGGGGWVVNQSIEQEAV